MTSPHRADADPRRGDLAGLEQTDQAWLAALGGLAAPEPGALPPGAGAGPGQVGTRETGQARQLRAYFEARGEYESASPLGATSEARMLARLHRLGAFQPARPSAVQPAPGPGQRLVALLDRLLPNGPGAGPRYALVAGVALAVMVVPGLLQHDAPPHDDGMRSVQLPVEPSQPAQRLLAPAPLQLAQQLQAQLQAAGIASQSKAAPPGVALQARIDPAQQPAAKAVLAPYGLTLPPDGELRLMVLPSANP